MIKKSTKRTYKKRLTAFQEIKKWNEDRNLLNKFDHKNEISFILEEILETFENVESKKGRTWAKRFAKIMYFLFKKPKDREFLVDAFADMIVFATGAIYKLGYDTDKVMKEVQKELNDRTGTLIQGKFVKDKKENLYKANFENCKL